MHCRSCGFENREGVRFCEECGSPLQQSCPACGAAVPPDRKFCGACGHRLDSGPAPVAAARRALAPESYTPKHLAERILASRGALEGERKLVTVLFADLKGSMELLADRDPEDARKLLDPVLQQMMDAVHRYEGTVNQVMGDGIMALFGAPLAHEDHAVRACYAALDMQAALRRFAEEARRTHGLEPQIRVGLHSGEVVVRAIGSDLHMDYTAVGQTTHLAARMEQLAPPGATRLTADTLRLAEGYVDVRPLGPVPVKGLDAPVEVYELTGAGPRRSRLHAAAARGLTRFVGRDTELEALRQALARAAAGHGQVVAIVGEPGVGKSRLVWEVTHSYRTHGWLILQGPSVSYGKATPYLPVIELLKAYFRIQDRDDRREIREKVIGRLLALDRALEPTLPALLALLDVPTDDPGWDALDPPQRRLRTLDAVKRLLLHECQLQPLLVVFEDLHWTDSETQAVLDSLVESLPTVRLLVLVNYRPEYRHIWSGKTYYSQLRLDPLSSESAEALLGALLGEDSGLRPIKALLIERTEGNPFFLEESVRTLVETGMLVGERGAWHLAQPLGAVQVPATVQAVLAARIDRLPPEDKRLLQAAAVLGKDVPLALLRAAADLLDEALGAGLARLQAAEFLYETQLFPDVEYTFKHALTHEVTYGGLLQERRRALHTRIVEAIERLYSDRLAEHVERLAHHSFRGEAWEKAAKYCREAGNKVYARSAARDAVAYFEQALHAIGRLPETRATTEAAIDVRLELRSPLAQLVEYERVLEHLRDAERLATAIGDRRRLGWVWGFMTFSLYQAGDYDGAVARGREALEAATTEDDPALARLTCYFIGQARLFAGDYRTALEFYTRAIKTEPREMAAGPALFRPGVVYAWTAMCLAELGRFGEAVARGEEALRLGDTLGDPFNRVAARYGLGVVRLQRGDLEPALRTLEQGLELCREWSIAMYLHRLQSALGYGYALAGRADEGIERLEDAVALFRSRKVVPGFSRTLAWLAEACLRAGRSDEARIAAGQALAAARETKDQGSEAWGLCLLGEVAAGADPPEAAAERLLREALTQAEALGMRLLVARCHLALGRLLRRTGPPGPAREHLAAAAAMFREMGIERWRAEAEAARAQD